MDLRHPVCVVPDGLCALINAKATSPAPGGMNPSETLAEAARYLARLVGRLDEDLLPMAITVMGRSEKRVIPSSGYRLALSVLRDFGD